VSVAGRLTEGRNASQVSCAPIRRLSGQTQPLDGHRFDPGSCVVRQGRPVRLRPSSAGHRLGQRDDRAVRGTADIPTGADHDLCLQAYLVQYPAARSAPMMPTSCTSASAQARCGTATTGQSPSPSRRPLWDLYSEATKRHNVSQALPLTSAPCWARQRRVGQPPSIRNAEASGACRGLHLLPASVTARGRWRGWRVKRRVRQRDPSRRCRRGRRRRGCRRASRRRLR
jgi:hypothetical protein